MSESAWLGQEQEGRTTIVFSDEDIGKARRGNFRYLDDTPLHVRGSHELVSSRLFDLVGLEVISAADSWSTLRIYRGKLVVLEVALTELRAGVFPTRVSCPEREALSFEIIGAERQVVISCHWRHVAS